MVCYYDSSILLAAVLEQHPAVALASCWDAASVRLSSTLLKIECLIGVRRAGALQSLPPDAPWVEQRIDLLRRYTDEVDCKRLDDEIEEIVRRTPALSECRTLDAVHLATALYLQPHQDEPVTVITLDRRMRELAGRLGFSILPS
jgi:predicted nucleic acid-binding protein